LGDCFLYEQLFYFYIYIIKETLKYKAKQLIAKAKQSGITNPNVTIASSNTSSLSKIIKSKKDGDAFIKMLKSV
jgi:hypothetical protein